MGEHLCSSGADVDAKMVGGKTPIHMAVWNDHTEVALLLHAATKVMCETASTDKCVCPECGLAWQERKPVTLPTILVDVNIGATHDGWGRKWDTCVYKCAQCQVAITKKEKVAACNACKCFWHTSCSA